MPKQQRLITLGFSLLAILVSSASFAAIYKCPGPSGQVIFSNTWCENGERKEGNQWINIKQEREQQAQRTKQRQERAEQERLEQERWEKENAATSQTNKTAPQTQPTAASSPSTAAHNLYRCDGRTRCTQMTSCEEATYFIQNCPNTEMDGDNDGIPCESQHCSYGATGNSSTSHSSLGRRRH